MPTKDTATELQAGTPGDSGPGAAGTQEAPGQGEQAPLVMGQGESPELTPELQQLITEQREKIEAEIRAEYEGHVKAIKAKYDQRVAAERKKRQEEIASAYQRGMELLEGGNREEAAQILAAVAQMQQQEIAGGQAENQTRQWMERIAGEFGYDLEAPETGQLLDEWQEKIQRDPNFQWDFQQELATKQIKAAHKQAENLQAEIKEAVRQQVNQLLAGTGIAIPAITEQGGTGPEAWRKKPARTLIQQGIAEGRKKTPIRR